MYPDIPDYLRCGRTGFAPTCQHVCATRSMKGGGNIKHMAYLPITIITLAFLAGSSAQAQQATCDEPPCGPAQFRGNDKYGTALIRCMANNPYPCIVSAGGGVKNLKVGSGGILDVLDDQGRPTGTYTYDSYLGQETVDGAVELRFKNLQKK